MAVADINDIGVTDLDLGVRLYGSGWLIMDSALLPYQGVVRIPGGECFKEHSIFHNLCNINVCCPWMSSNAEETKLN